MKALHTMFLTLKKQKVSNPREHFTPEEQDLIDDYDFMLKNGVFKDMKE